MITERQNYVKVSIINENIMNNIYYKYVFLVMKQIATKTYTYISYLC